MNEQVPRDESEVPTTVPHVRVGNRLFGRYVVVRKLGRGGNAEVWLAMDEKIQGPVALKFLPTIFSAREYLDQLREEASRGLTLTHQNIVHVRNFEHEESIAAIAMEFVDGDTLLQLRLQQENGVFEPAQLFPWVEQLCGALHYAHTSVRIVHRDLKPSNLMINQRGELKITDFGISMPVAETMMRTTGRHFGSGTIPYMSPEQLGGRSPKAVQDVYSLGATLYELMTSKPPYFRGDIRFQVLDPDRIPPSMADRRIELERIGQPIPRYWEDVVAACLAKDPAARPQTALEVLERLRPKPPVVITPPPSRTSGRRSMVLILAGFLTIVGLMAVVVFQWAEREKEKKARLAQELSVLRNEMRKVTPTAAPGSGAGTIPEVPPPTEPPIPEQQIPVKPEVITAEKTIPSPPAQATPPDSVSPSPPGAPFSPAMPLQIEPPLANPITNPIPSAPTQRDDRAAIREFITAHLQREKSDSKGHRNYDAIINDYDTLVNMDDREAATHTQILKDKVSYFTLWPFGGETIDGDVKIEPAGESEWNATFRTRIDRWIATPKRRTRRGNVELTYRIRRVGDEFKICAEHVITRSFR